VTEAFCPASPTEAAAFRQRKGLPERFIFFLGTLEPRKNLVRLIEAYAEWRRASGEPVKLVLAGAKGWYYHQIFARVDQLGLVDDVIFPDFVPDDELPWWYRAAELFVYPSLFEGFGLPVLEALACGTPVITSTASSLPEVAGCAVLLVNAEETAALATAIGRVMADRSLAATLREAGPRQAAQFSWARAAAATADVYCAVLEGRSPGGPA
jgi:glycosyltransferase involved in cell wall biosynthesis